MLQIKFKTTYRKRDNTKGFIYIVIGDQKELDTYVAAKVAQGMAADKIKNAEGVVFFSNDYIGASAPLEISAKGNYYPDTTQHDIMISMQQQIHSTTGTKIAEAA